MDGGGDSAAAARDSTARDSEFRRVAKNMRHLNVEPRCARVGGQARRGVGILAIGGGIHPGRGGGRLSPLLLDHFHRALDRFVGRLHFLPPACQASILGLQSRVRWTIEPGNDVFFIFGQGWVQDLERGYDFRRQDSRLAMKFQYTIRF